MHHELDDYDREERKLLIEEFEKNPKANTSDIFGRVGAKTFGKYKAILKDSGLYRHIFEHRQEDAEPHQEEEKDTNGDGAV